MSRARTAIVLALLVAALLAVPACRASRPFSIQGVKSMRLHVGQRAPFEGVLIEREGFWRIARELAER